MADCCNDKASHQPGPRCRLDSGLFVVRQRASCRAQGCEIETLRMRQAATLRVVLGINAGMFVVELAAGLVAGSVALIADSLDMLGDALVYAFSLYVVTQSARMKAVAAMLKGGLMAAFGLFVLGQAGYRMLFPETPVFETIGVIGLLALAANAVCLGLLWRHRSEDINMRSVWLCSRNDIIANVSVLAAAVGVWVSQSAWPDILVGLALASLFLRSALSVLREASEELRAGIA